MGTATRTSRPAVVLRHQGPCRLAVGEFSGVPGHGGELVVRGGAGRRDVGARLVDQCGRPHHRHVEAADQQGVQAGEPCVGVGGFG